MKKNKNSPEVISEISLNEGICSLCNNKKFCTWVAKNKLYCEEYK